MSDRLTHPRADGVEHFDARSEATQEEAAFALAADPRGYGNPDEGRRHLHRTRGRPGPSLTIRTEAFTALIGNPAGDARGEPALELRRR